MNDSEFTQVRLAERDRCLAIMETCIAAGRPEFAATALRCDMSIGAVRRDLGAAAAPKHDPIDRARPGDDFNNLARESWDAYEQTTGLRAQPVTKHPE